MLNFDITKHYIMKKLLSLLLVLVISIPIFGQSFKVIPVPYVGHNPLIPHPTYSEHKTILKAIVRSESLNVQYYYRWDADGDGTWDDMGHTMAVPEGSWYRGLGHRIEGWFIYPELPAEGPDKKIITARLQVSQDLAGSEPIDPVFATYRLIQYKGIPAAVNLDQATDDQLEIVRSVVSDDLLWGLHQAISSSRTGVGTVNILAYLTGSSLSYNIGNTGLAALSFLVNGHMPAYPPGTYQVYSEAPMEGFIEQNDFLYNNDPYSEDLLRLLNYLLQRLAETPVASYAEADDASIPIAGTNDQKGYSINGLANYEVNQQGFAAAALASSGLMGTEVQLDDISQGKSWEFVIQQVVDYIQHNQMQSGIHQGGWYTMLSSSISSSYQTGGWIYALETIMRNCESAGVYVNDNCKTNIVNILKRYQYTDGGAVNRLDSPPTSLFEATSLLFNACRFMGWDMYSESDNELIGPAGQQITKGAAKQVYDMYSNYLIQRWTQAGGSTYYDPSRALWTDGSYSTNPPARNLWTYSLFFTTQGAINKSLPINYLGTHNIYREFLISIFKDFEYSAGGEATPYIFEGYVGRSLVYDRYGYMLGSTGLASNILASFGNGESLEAIPIASVTEVLEGCAGGPFGKVEFSHNESFSFSASRRIVDYQWIFDSNNMGDSEFDSYDWSSIPENTLYNGVWHSSSPEISIIYKYLYAGNYTASLRVVDDAVSAETDISTLQIKVDPMAPVDPSANAGGPYLIAEGDDLVLYGVAYDQNQPCTDEVLMCKWYIEDTEILSQASGTVPWSTLESLGLAADNIYSLELVVCDETNRETSATTQLIVTVATGEEKLNENTDLVLYPNPVGNFLHLKAIAAFSGECIVSVINDQGKLVIVKNISDLSSEYILETSALAPGKYYVHIKSGSISQKVSFIKL